MPPDEVRQVLAHLLQVVQVAQSVQANRDVTPAEQKLASETAVAAWEQIKALVSQGGAPAKSKG